MSARNDEKGGDELMVLVRYKICQTRNQVSLQGKGIGLNDHALQKMGDDEESLVYKLFQSAMSRFLTLS